MSKAAKVLARSGWLLAALAACSADTQLKELSDATLVVEVRPSDMGPAAAPMLSLFLFPNEKAHGSSERHERRKLSTHAKASFNGQPLKRLIGTYAFGDLTYDRDGILELSFPGEVVNDRGGPPVEMAGPIPAAARTGASALIRIEDSSASWTATLPDALSPRTLSFEAPTGPGQPSIRRGDTVVLRWSPSTDVLNGKEMRMRLQQPGRGLEGVIIESDQLTITGDRLSFTVPADVPERLNGPIQVQLLGQSMFTPKLSGCPVHECKGWLEFPVGAVNATLH